MTENSRFPRPAHTTKPPKSLHSGRFCSTPSWFDIAWHGRREKINADTPYASPLSRRILRALLIVLLYTLCGNGQYRPTKSYYSLLHPANHSASQRPALADALTLNFASAPAA